MDRQCAYIYQSGTGNVDGSAATKHAGIQAVIINNPTATAVVTIRDGGSSGAIVFKYTAPTGAVPVSFNLNGARCAGGIYLSVATAAADVTVTYN